MTHPPTDEQQHAIDVASGDTNVVIEAYAGTGKTSTLEMIATALPQRRMQYIAFNKSIVAEASGRFPTNVTCSTAHSLAFREVGKHYSSRLKAPRMKAQELAQILRLPEFTCTVLGTNKRLAPGFLAGLVKRSIGIFVQTGDPEPTTAHMPTVPGIDEPSIGDDGKLINRRGSNNRTLALMLEPYMRAWWADVSSRNGRLPFTHGDYLKLWQLSEPRIHTDVILYDECQPTGTRVDLPGGGQKAIEDVVPGDRVVSYHMKSLALNDRVGSVVSGVSKRRFAGDLIQVNTDTGKRSLYTPNHHCIARIGPAFEGKSVLYLMRQGDRWRVGVTSAHHGRRPGNTAGIVGRLREERGDEAWVLDVFDTRAEAVAAEQMASLSWRLPQCRFSDPFWGKWDPSLSHVHECLMFYGRDREYPFVDSTRRYMLYERATIVRACNLLTGMLVLDADEFSLLGGKGKCLEAWRPITVGRQVYHGDVWSMTVEGSHTYVGDGIITHNCQDANGCMLAIVNSQHDAQLVFVGDTYQQIYEWNGAVNALQRADPTAPRARLTESFRFGPEIAAKANVALEWLGAPELLKGRGPAGRVEALVEPDAILFRTNGKAVARALQEIRRGRKVALVGGAEDVISFARAADDLKRTGRCYHPELQCFDSWGEVKDYVENDPSGSDLKVLVSLVDEFGTDTIRAELGRCYSEHQADIILSTAHKAKGREWGSVTLASDFPDPEERNVSDEDVRLLYVAATRAKTALDVTDVGFYKEIKEEA